MQFLPACRFAGMFLLVLHFERMAGQALLVLHFERMAGQVLLASHSEQKAGQAHLEQIEGEVVLLAYWSEQNLAFAAAEAEGVNLAA